MRKPITCMVNTWKVLVSSQGDSLIIEIPGLAYVYSQIKERGVAGARLNSNLMQDWDFRIVPNSFVTEKSGKE